MGYQADDEGSETDDRRQEIMPWIYAHLIGDYLLQTHWMAVNKKSSNFACSIHVLAYMLPFLFCGISWGGLLLIAGQHWMQDRTTMVQWFMDHTGKGAFSQPPLGPWSVIVTDNIFHILWIAGVANYIG